MNPRATVLGTARQRRSLAVIGDPRFLIILFAIIVVVTFIIDGVPGLSVILLYVVALHALNGTATRMIAGMVKKVLPFVVLIITINAYLVDGTAFAFPFSIFSREGFVAGVYYSMRVTILYLSTILIASMSSQEALASGLASLVKPFSRRLARRVALYGLLSLGSLPVFADELERIRLAQRFRGGGLDGGVARKLKGVRLLIVPLLISAIHRSGQLAMAVELRDIKNTIGRVLILARPGTGDFAIAGITVGVLVGAFLM